MFLIVKQGHDMFYKRLIVKHRSVKFTSEQWQRFEAIHGGKISNAELKMLIISIFERAPKAESIAQQRKVARAIVNKKYYNKHRGL